MNKLIYIFVMITLLGCATQEMLRVRQMEIQTIDLTGIGDGKYVGAFAYGGFEYRVETIVEAHKIVAIKILQNRNTKHARLAEGVVPEIIRMQTPDVDAVSGATTTSKALMKAVENSLREKR